MKKLFVFLAMYCSTSASAQSGYWLYLGGMPDPSPEMHLTVGTTVPITLMKVNKGANYSEGQSIPCEWTVDGHTVSAQDDKEGMLTIGSPTTGPNAFFKTPAQEPPHNPVVITCTFMGGGSKYILYARIYVVQMLNY